MSYESAEVSRVIRTPVIPFALSLHFALVRVTCQPVNHAIYFVPCTYSVCIIFNIYGINAIILHQYQHMMKVNDAFQSIPIHATFL
jgi:hypothetical protein